MKAPTKFKAQPMVSQPARQPASPARQPAQPAQPASPPASPASPAQPAPPSQPAKPASQPSPASPALPSQPASQFSPAHGQPASPPAIGCKDKATQRKLLSESELTFDKALKVAMAMEIANRDVEQLHSSDNGSEDKEVHQLRTTQMKERSSSKWNSKLTEKEKPTDDNTERKEGLPLGAKMDDFCSPATDSILYRLDVI
ncbi:swi5-dependent recombination DNA repair protein 1 homolog [Strongylocentrotus purpuratus]|uniref:Uncharacterized protein n=1 Tax=Strongylocentrotus purpuratus TaxID=7668 RepID=A0A7M7NZT0_STRPU|nr:swi5-dependent recombination DNA repair protein 1 homolog [Strongylocentrotus purpuratus]